ncbi:MAG: entericidin A/B family lipoprotein [Sulfuricella sp.]
MRMMKIGFPLFCVLFLAACNTVQGVGKSTANLGNRIEHKGEEKNSPVLKGVGKDMSAVGEKIEQSAEGKK